VIEFYGINPQKSEWFGRCINKKAFERLYKLLIDGKSEIMIGGEFDEKDNFISPTIFDYGSNLKKFKELDIMKDEIFGPLLPAIRYKDVNEAIEFIRNLRTGKSLALYAFGNDEKFIKEIKQRTTSGGLCINDVIMHLANDELPFGGVGNSGMGGYHGPHSFETFTHKKAVLQKSARLDESFLFRGLLQMRFPPYTPMKIWVVKTFGTYKVSQIMNAPLRYKKFIILFIMMTVMYLCGFRIKKV